MSEAEQARATTCPECRRQGWDHDLLTEGCGHGVELRSCRECGLTLECDDDDRDCPLCHTEDSLDDLDDDVGIDYSTPPLPDGGRW